MAVKRVLVQMGHVAPRQPGFESATGANGEISFTSQLGPALKRVIEADPRLDCQLIPGRIPSGVYADAFIALHYDGAGNPATRGYCFGYPDFHENRKLRDALQVEYEKLVGHPPHRTDNYTADLRGYYGFRLVNITGAEVLVEHGFGSNPTDRAWMFANIERIAQSHYRALLRYFDLDPLPPPEDKPYRIVKIHKDDTIVRENVGKLGVANAVQTFLRGQFKELRIKRL